MSSLNQEDHDCRLQFLQVSHGKLAQRFPSSRYQGHRIRRNDEGFEPRAADGVMSLDEIQS